MKTVSTYTASIYVGTREQYTPTVRSIEMAREFLRDWVNREGLCVTLTPTEYIYTNGGEPGFIVGLINYPRFPDEAAHIRRKALAMAEGLRELYKQLKVTVVFPDETVMLEREEGSHASPVTDCRVGTQESVSVEPDAQNKTGLTEQGGS